MNIHLISIGGSIMHNLALDLQKNGHSVSGSDDQVYEPSKSRLAAQGLLPKEMGWDEANIHEQLDLVILGMHAKKDNPELLKANELGLQVVSFPEYVAMHSKDKTRVVVAGSHGKTTTTSMIMHVLRHHGVDFDYLVGAKLDGFDRMVRLSDAPIIILEGDEYLSSAIDSRSKMLHYYPQLAVITGIEWDHINVFPTFESYTDSFIDFANTMKEGSKLFLSGEDDVLMDLFETRDLKTYSQPYFALDVNSDGLLKTKDRSYQLGVFGVHNFQNMSAAKKICAELGINDSDFFEAMESFSGAAKRLQKLSDKPLVYLDFAHAPSKVRATVKAIRSKYAEKRIACVLEIHSYSSLNPDFLPFYADTLHGLESKAVFCNAKALEIKQMAPIVKEIILSAFNDSSIEYIREKDVLASHIENIKKEYDLVLVMSSGQLGGVILV